MLDKDPAHRLHASEILDHTWITVTAWAGFVKIYLILSKCSLCLKEQITDNTCKFK